MTTLALTPQEKRALVLAVRSYLSAQEDDDKWSRAMQRILTKLGVSE